MDYDEYKKEKIQFDLKEEEYRDANEKEYLVKFTGSIYINALDESEAEERMRDRDDLEEYIDIVRVV